MREPRPGGKKPPAPGSPAATPAKGLKVPDVSVPALPSAAACTPREALSRLPGRQHGNRAVTAEATSEPPRCLVSADGHPPAQARGRQRDRPP